MHYPGLLAHYPSWLF
uniref:Uncharacterized protein n=1 Tax=Anguilla anguilla TaxID=7936 RepID=A0A0E9RV50_ANGAN